MMLLIAAVWCFVRPFELTAVRLRRATIGLRIVPCFVGAAFRNKGVQPLMDAVALYLPSPLDVHRFQVGNRRVIYRTLLDLRAVFPFQCYALPLTQ